MSLLQRFCGSLTFRRAPLRSLADSRLRAIPAVCLSAGFLAYLLVRDRVYAGLTGSVQPGAASRGVLLGLTWIVFLGFVFLVYLPFVIALSNAFAGDGLGFTLSKEEYRRHVSALLPVWGLLLLVVAPVQYLMPQFVVLGMVAISIAMLLLLPLFAVYTVWILSEVNAISLPLACGVFALSWLTLPVLYALASGGYIGLLALVPLLIYLVARLSSESAGRGADPVPSEFEGLYREALALRDAGDIDGMRLQLHALLDRARTAPAALRRRERERILSSRALLFDSRR
jgi:hypothetical protein